MEITRLVKPNEPCKSGNLSSSIHSKNSSSSMSHSLPVHPNCSPVRSKMNVLPSSVSTTKTECLNCLSSSSSATKANSGFGKMMRYETSALYSGIAVRSRMLKQVVLEDTYFPNAPSTRCRPSHRSFHTETTSCTPLQKLCLPYLVSPNFVQSW